MKWTISVPCWGKWHTDLFYKYALPSHLRMGLEGCRYLIHTNAPQDFKRAEEALKGICEVEIKHTAGRRYEDHARYRTMTDSHLDAMKGAEAVMFLPPDAIVSSNTRKAIEASGKKMTMVCSLRTFGGGDPPDDPEKLNEWAVDNLHPSQKGWIWGNPIGIDLIHSHVYFRDEGGFWCHAFHLHPLAAVLDRTIKPGKSIDSFLPSYYKPYEMWLVANSEIAMATFDPRDKYQDLERGPETVASIADSVKQKIKDRHLGFFHTPIRLKGRIGSSTIPAEIIAAIGKV